PRPFRFKSQSVEPPGAHVLSQRLILELPNVLPIDELQERFSACRNVVLNEQRNFQLLPLRHRIPYPIRLSLTVLPKSFPRVLVVISSEAGPLGTTYGSR